jgi:hypothetical protein
VRGRNAIAWLTTQRSGFVLVGNVVGGAPREHGRQFQLLRPQADVHATSIGGGPRTRIEPRIVATRPQQPALR